MKAITVEDLDPTDERAAREFWETEQAAHRADRAHPVIRTWLAFRAELARPADYARRHWLVVRVGGRVVGTTQLDLPLQDNQHLGALEVCVEPEHRRRGIGSALHAEAVRRARAAHRQVMLAEVLTPGAGRSPASRFAESLGYETKHFEHHLLLQLPIAAAAVAEWGVADPAYEIVGWEGACPEVWRPAYLAMLNQMNTDVPTGELDYEPIVFDEGRLRAQEERIASAYEVVVAAARHRSSGAFCGYSVMYLPRDDMSIARQDDTLVMPAHRGHRLGLSLKRANLELVQRDHPRRRWLHSWTAPDNIAMYRTNQRVGFWTIEHLHEMQLPLKPG